MSSLVPVCNSGITEKIISELSPSCIEVIRNPLRDMRSRATLLTNSGTSAVFPWHTPGPHEGSPGISMVPWHQSALLQHYKEAIF